MKVVIWCKSKSFCDGMKKKFMEILDDVNKLRGKKIVSWFFLDINMVWKIIIFYNLVYFSLLLLSKFM